MNLKRFPAGPLLSSALFFCLALSISGASLYSFENIGADTGSVSADAVSVGVGEHVLATAHNSAKPPQVAKQKRFKKTSSDTATGECSQGALIVVRLQFLIPEGSDHFGCAGTSTFQGRAPPSLF
jgi:hypothetical protein